MNKIFEKLFSLKPKENNSIENTKPHIFRWDVDDNVYPAVYLETDNLITAVETVINFWKQTYPDQENRMSAIFNRMTEAKPETFYRTPFQFTHLNDRTDIRKQGNGYLVEMSGNHDPISIKMMEWIKAQNFEGMPQK